MGTRLKLSAIDFFYSLKNSLLSWNGETSNAGGYYLSLSVLLFNLLTRRRPKNRRRICKEVVTTIEASPKRTPHYPNKENERRLSRYVAVVILITIAFCGKSSRWHHQQLEGGSGWTDYSSTVTNAMYNQALCLSLYELAKLDIFLRFFFIDQLHTVEILVWWFIFLVFSMGSNKILYMRTPYTELPFDVWKESHLVSEGVLHSMDDVCSMEFTSMVVQFWRTVVGPFFLFIFVSFTPEILPI